MPFTLLVIDSCVTHQLIVVHLTLTRFGTYLVTLDEKMAEIDVLKAQMVRPDDTTPWGFRFMGGPEFGTPLRIEIVCNHHFTLCILQRVYLSPSYLHGDLDPILMCTIYRTLL